MLERIRGVARRGDGEASWGQIEAHYSGLVPGSYRGVKTLNFGFNVKVFPEKSTTTFVKTSV